MRIYLGKISLDQAAAELLKEVFWIVGLAFVSIIIWKKGIRQYFSMGD
jgi:ABC-type uncharacterized transport system permease subunit